MEPDLIVKLDGNWTRIISRTVRPNGKFKHKVVAQIYDPSMVSLLAAAPKMLAMLERFADDPEVAEVISEAKGD